PSVAATDYELVVVYYHAETSLLFLCCSSGLRSVGAFEGIATSYTDGSHQILPLYELGRILSGLSDVRCYSIGLRNRVRSSRTESYRIVAASRAERAIKPVDGRLFHRGHVDCSANDGTTRVSLGYSSASKIWSRRPGTIGELVAWCNRLAKRIDTKTNVPPVPGLDYLAEGQPLVNIPAGAFAVEWDPDVYGPNVSAVADGEDIPVVASELDLVLDSAEKNTKSLTFRVVRGNKSHQYRFTPSSGRLIVSEGGDLVVRIREGAYESSLVDYLNAQPPTFHFSDLSMARGMEYFANKAGINPLDDARQLCPFDWPKEADICLEYDEADSFNPRTIHGVIHDVLVGDAELQVVVYDHRTGEMADFISVSETSAFIEVTLYHCKASGGPSPGSRVADIYELSGQVVKCLHFLHDEKRLRDHVRRRTKSGSSFCKGDLASFNRMLAGGRAKPIEYRVIAVQPGLSKHRLLPAHREVLAAASTLLTTTGAHELKVLCSD
ncbi:MAG: hypothetical protein AAFX05_08600, partial [Planctomycetota bacterium]